MVGDDELTREQLKAANAGLRRANARLARKWLGKSDTAAASLLAKLEAEREELEARLGKLEPRDPEMLDRYALIRRVEELHHQVLAQEHELREIRSTTAWRVISGYWSAKDRVMRLVRRSSHAQRPRRKSLSRNRQ